MRLAKRCRDGRACTGSLGHDPSFIPDDQDYCDACLIARYELDVVHDSCCCGHYSEEIGFSTESVLRLLKGTVEPRRYYVQMRIDHSSETAHYGVYDSAQAWPREPVEEYGPPRFKHGSSKRAYKRARELNELFAAEVVP